MRRKKSLCKENKYSSFSLLFMSIALVIYVGEVSFSSIDTSDKNYVVSKEKNTPTARGVFNEGKKSLEKSSLEPIYRVDTMDKKISITFDLNWADEEYLDEILDILDKYEIKATFFVMGRWLVYPDKENQEKLIEIHKRGHEIGNHSYTHADFKNINKEKMIKEIKDTEKLIKDITGITTEIFRFPSGHYNHDAVSVAQFLGYQSIQWDVDSIDWKQLGLEQEYNRVIKKTKPGSIMLFHNNGKYTPQNLERFIPKLQGEGFKFVPVGQLIYKDGFYIDNEGVQRVQEG
jgi:peptidoglycan-N-acetylglucosamine deacetylase